MTDDTLSFLLERDGRPSESAGATADASIAKMDASAEPSMLEFSLVGGELLTFPYRTLFVVALNPSRGIIATFSTHNVTITGVHLRSIYDAIVSQKIGRLEAVGTRPQRLVEGVAVIFTITAEERT